MINIPLLIIVSAAAGVVAGVIIGMTLLAACVASGRADEANVRELEQLRREFEE